MAKSFIDSLGLNKVQKEAVLYNDGSELVFAGAGTGKTRVLTAKIAWLMKEQGLAPHQIFAATFTNKAASEMKERITSFIGDSCRELWIGTFHSLAVRILRREADKLGYSRGFTIYDSGDQVALMKKVMKDSMVDEKTLQPKAILHTISSFKNKCLTPEAVTESAQAFYDKEIAHLYTRYQEGLKRADAMDFDDLLTNVVRFFHYHPNEASYYIEQFKYILVDEYQDTNGAQFLLIKALAGGKTPVFAVGDDDQSIYGWRGAEVQNILTFQTHFPRTQIFKLEQNYRSSKAILDFANAVIKHNVHRAAKSLWTEKRAGEEVVVRAFTEDRKEATNIVQSIHDQIEYESVNPGSIAILFRTNAQSRLFEDALRKRNVPHVLVAGTSFYERKEIKDVLAYIKLLINPKDDVSCQRILNVPARGIGAKSQEVISVAAREAGLSNFQLIVSGEAEHTVKGKAKSGVARFRATFNKLLTMTENGESPEGLVRELLIDTAYIEELGDEKSEEVRSRIENINELINAIAEWQQNHIGGTLADFLEEITLASDVDGWDKGEAVNLMTLHAAKGLEFDYIYLVGVEEGILPSKQNMDDPATLEEERRLLYVGATRAQKRLICSYAQNRMRFGSVMPMAPSSFLKNVPREMYKYIDETAKFRTLSFEDEVSQSSSFSHDRRQVKRGVAGSGGIIRRGSEVPSARLDTPVVSTESSGGNSYRMGQRVAHHKFGTGKVMNVSGFGPDMRVTILFEGGIRKQLVAKFAKLEIL